MKLFTIFRRKSTVVSSIITPQEQMAMACEKRDINQISQLISANTQALTWVNKHGTLLWWSGLTTRRNDTCTTEITYTQFLIDHGADFKVWSGFGHSLVHELMSGYHHESLLALLQAGKVDFYSGIRADYTHTPAHWASFMEPHRANAFKSKALLEAYEIILKATDPNTKTADGTSVIDMASKYQNTFVLGLITKYHKVELSPLNALRLAWQEISANRFDTLHDVKADPKYQHLLRITYQTFTLPEMSHEIIRFFRLVHPDLKPDEPTMPLLEATKLTPVAGESWMAVRPK